VGSFCGPHKSIPPCVWLCCLSNDSHEKLGRQARGSTVENSIMRRIPLGILLGIVIGAVDVLLMLPLAFPDKRAALAGAFVSRFSLGFFAATVQLPVSPVLAGMIVGLLTSVPDAIITKAYVPIMISGIVFGAVAGWIVGRCAR
jgi:hypothetical protein